MSVVMQPDRAKLCACVSEMTIFSSIAAACSSKLNLRQNARKIALQKQRARRRCDLLCHAARLGSANRGRRRFEGSAQYFCPLSAQELFLGRSERKKRRPWRSHASASWKSGTSSQSPISRLSRPRKLRAGSSRCGTRRKTELSGVRLRKKLPMRSELRGALAVRVEDKRQGPPKLHDLPSLQKLCGSPFGWPASKTLESDLRE